MPNPPEELRVFVDRIEEDIAVLLCAETEPTVWHVPVRFLPAEVREGDRLSCRFLPEPVATAAAMRYNASLRAQLPTAKEKEGDG